MFNRVNFGQISKAIIWCSFFHTIKQVWSNELIDLVSNISFSQKLLASHLLSYVFYCYFVIVRSWEMHFMDINNRWVKRIFSSTISLWKHFVLKKYLANKVNSLPNKLLYTALVFAFHCHIFNFLLLQYNFSVRVNGLIHGKILKIPKEVSSKSGRTVDKETKLEVSLFKFKI